MIPNSIAGQGDQFSAREHNQSSQPYKILDVQQADCYIVGGGPSGAVLALLLARQEISIGTDHWLWAISSSCEVLATAQEWPNKKTNCSFLRVQNLQFRTQFCYWRN